jgi:AcrR family transcriptional regulator
MSSKDKLIEAARQCLLERGHQACSVKAIAQQAGVNHGLVHHYFGSKEQLWIEVMGREAEQVRASLHAAPQRFLHGFYLPEMLRRPDRVGLMVEMIAMAKGLPALAAALKEHMRLNRRALRERLELEDDALATLAFAALFGLVIQAAVDPELEVQPAAERLLALVASGREADLQPAAKADRSR